MGIHKNPVVPNDLYTQATKSVSGSLCVYSFVELALLLFVHGSANCLTSLNLLIHLWPALDSLNIVLLLEKINPQKFNNNVVRSYQMHYVFLIPHISRFVAGDYCIWDQ